MMLPSPDETDEDLMQMVSRGDTSAFAMLYDRLAPKAYALILRLLRNQNAAEDVLQETFLQVWRKASTFDCNRCRAEGWVIMLARSRALDQLRKRQPLASLITEEPGKQDSATFEVIESNEKLSQLLAGLPPEQHEPIRLAFFDGCTHEEIAQRLAQPLGTIKTRIRLGMNKLRVMLGNTDPRNPA